MSRLQQRGAAGTGFMLDQPLAQVLGRVSEALQEAGYGLFTVVEVAPGAPEGNLVCEIACLTVPAERAAPATAPARVLPCTIRLQAEGDQTRVRTTVRGAAGHRLLPAGEMGAAQAACACVQQTIEPWIDAHSITP